ncbi:DUF5719 family protein [Propionibacteriaceae bacterium G1746]|uniref:DUF5719 family protein n=1 Tax=Aestuariimicrobium sp. G57 TaxID=3418485 RepID=UPI003C1C4486
MKTILRRFGPLLAVVGPMMLAFVLVGIASLVPAQRPRPVQVVPTQPLRSLSCAFGGAPGSLITTAPDSVTTDLTGAVVDNPSTNGSIRGSVLVDQRAVGVLAAGVRAQSSAGLSWSECAPATTGGAVIVPDPATAEVLLVNPDSPDAGVNMSLSGPSGEIQSPGLRGVVVPGRSMVRVPLNVHAPAGSPVTLSYEASQGRVQVATRTTSGAPEQAVTTSAKLVSVFASTPAGASQTRLLLHNPSDQRVEARVEMLGVRGRFAPPNGEVSLQPNTTVALDLTQTVQGTAMGVVVTGSDELVAMVAAVVGPDIAWVLPQQPAHELTDATPAGTLQLVNPSAQDVTASVTMHTLGGTGGGAFTVQIPAGASVERSIVAGEVNINATGEVAAAVRLTGSGAAVSRVRPQVQDVAPAPGTLDPQLGQ